MKIKLSAILCAFTLIGMTFNAAAEDIVKQIETGCADEIKNYCSQVSLGEGRLLACFYAHEDKLSGQCQYALYDASAQLERATSALNYLAGQCGDDIEAHCAQVEMGEGRIIECLRGNSEIVSAQCTQAIADVVE